MRYVARCRIWHAPTATVIAAGELLPEITAKTARILLKGGFIVAGEERSEKQVYFRVEDFAEANSGGEDEERTTKKTACAHCGH